MSVKEQAVSVKEQAERLRGLMKVGEAAALCGVSTETLRNWDKAGQLVAVRHPVTGFRYYRREDVETFIGQRVAERAEQR